MSVPRLLAEATFLLGLDPHDKLHKKVMGILKLRKKTYFELALSSAAILEVANILRSRGYDVGIEHYTYLLEQMEDKYGEIRISPVTGEHIDYALKLLARYVPKYGRKKVSFHDCVYVATAYIEGYALIVRDYVMKQILKNEGMYYIDLDKSDDEIYADITWLSHYEQLPYGMLGND